MTQRVTFTAFVFANGKVAKGKVTFKDGSQTLATRNLQSGVATVSTAALAAGKHTIRAFFKANGNFAGSSTSLKQRVK